MPLSNLLCYRFSDIKYVLRNALNVRGKGGLNNGMSQVRSLLKGAINDRVNSVWSLFAFVR